MGGRGGEGDSVNLAIIELQDPGTYMRDPRLSRNGRVIEQEVCYRGFCKRQLLISDGSQRLGA